MSNKAPLIGLGVAITLGALLIVAAIKDYDRLMDECLADGKKRYECVGILNSKTVVVR